MVYNRRDVNWGVWFVVLTMPSLVYARASHADDGVVAKWGNAVYVDLAVGDSITFLGRQVKLISTHASHCTVRVDGVNIGTYSLAQNEFQWTPEAVIPVRDGRLTIRMHIKDDNSLYAAVKRIQFQRIRR